jgi:hypothetical protein
MKAMRDLYITIRERERHTVKYTVSSVVAYAQKFHAQQKRPNQTWRIWRAS